MARRLACAGVVATTCSIGALAADVPVVPRLSEAEAAIHVDGRLDEAVWATLTGVDRFTVVSPDTGATPPYATVAKLFYTERGLYAGIWNEIPRELQVARLSARDARTTRDEIFIGIDASGNGLYGYLIALGLGGAYNDATILPEKEINDEWDGPWIGNTMATEEGWYAEFFLPWSMFALPESADERQLGIYVSRKVGYKNESWTWPALPRTQPKYLSGFHKVAIEGVDPKKEYAFYPYASVTRKRVRGETDTRVGADLFFRPSTGMQLTATINPDFGQVEQDELEVNLTAFETFFPEQRPFFVEGREIFNTGRNNLANTRRIGAPNEAPDLADEEAVADVELAEATDLYGALKMTGQRGNLRYGFMTAFEEDTEYVATSPAGKRQVTAEGSDFYVGRLLWEESNGSYRALGLMATLADHYDDDASVVALDGRYRSGDGAWDWWGQALRSDTDEVAHGLSGDLTWRPDRGIRHNLQLDWLEAGLDLNDLGYLRRDDQRRFMYERAHEETGIGDMRFRERFWYAETSFNQQGRMVQTMLGAGQFWQMNSNHEYSFNLEYFPARWDDRNSLGNGDFRVQDRWFGEVAYASDSARVWQLFTAVNMRKEVLGDWTFGSLLQITYIPSDRFDLKLELRYDRRHGWLVYQEDRDFTTFSAEQWFPRIESNLFFSARQQLRAVVQWIGVKAREDEFYEVPVGGGRLQSRVKAPGAEKDDFTISSLVFQLRYKWEIAPLSDLFVVYTRGGNMDGAGIEDDFGTLLSDTFNEPIAELFVVKLRYRFGG